MNQEIKVCQNCQQNFTIEPEDFEFYTKIKVPPPTWCPECQFMRRLTFRNEHTLYRRKDSIEGKDIISTYSQDKPIKVYEQKYWWSDKWDAMEYGKDYDLGNFANLFLFKVKFQEFKIKNIHRYAEIVKSVNSDGNDIFSSKNCHRCFDVNQVEDSKNLCIAGWGLKDSYSCSHTGHKAELVYDSLGVFSGSSRVFLSLFIPNSFNIQYSYFCQNSSNLFGCIGLRNKQYCILNKQYTPERYKELVESIKEHMNEMPYIDKKGRIYKYGEFFPPELSPFSYNETIAQEYFPLTKEQVIEKGYNWKDSEERNIKIDLKSEDLPDHIKDVNDDILTKVIQCATFSRHSERSEESRRSFANAQDDWTPEASNCTTAFKIIKSELDFYRKMNLPLPRLCPNCRHYQRLKQRNPLKLWKRQCQCNGKTSSNGVYQNTATHQHGTEPCPNTFETTYNPDRPEIVYCEHCYQQEVV